MELDAKDIILYLDMDGVIADFFGEISKIYVDHS